MNTAMAIIILTMLGHPNLVQATPCPSQSGFQSNGTVIPYRYFGPVYVPRGLAASTAHRFFRLDIRPGHKSKYLSQAEINAVEQAIRCLPSAVVRNLYYAFTESGAGERAQFVLFQLSDPTNDKLLRTPRATVIPGGRIEYAPRSGEISSFL